MKARMLEVVLLVVSGLVGGALSNVLLRGGPALAQGGAVAKEIRAERFVLVDQADRPRAELSLLRDDPLLALIDGEGKLRAELSLVDDCPKLVLGTEAGTPQAELSVVNDVPRLLLSVPGHHPQAELNFVDGEPILSFRDAAGEPRTWLSTEGGDPRLVLSDGSDRARMILGREAVMLIDTAGNPRAGLFLPEGGEPWLRLSGATGDPQMSLSLVGEPKLWISDAAGQPRVILGSTETEDTRTGATIRHPISTITLFDETGRVRWQAP